ncbi:ring-cleaving dioxygenase [Metabacillus sediminilitoris]|uniref:Ring-cleaving dioxygenase n=1 Tax=Metabacillus sediminilitoris TaxID=2567941 RepID=A0A4S4BYD3_9BACI|nr:ring-cleaving dioxygenase [Metabacillus sediminilitoris]QGQ46056.1 ring-cleaving dioxygenase [Metabacillus sediminilitoris]THF79740.1 ring-cleaving dioxygenase [Metabacillus sediminilitoris]
MNLKPLKGIHHVSAITANAKKNFHFYTKVLGLRLIKKTVNQDDTSVYHLFYADERGNPGTDLTFFEIPYAGRTYQGTNSISATSLRVKDNQALHYWKQRFEQLKVDHEAITNESGRMTISFRDPEGQRLILVSDEENHGVSGGKPWENSPVPQQHGVIGLGPVHLTVSRPERTIKVLTDIMGFHEKAGYQRDIDQKQVRVFETGEGGTGAEIHIVEDDQMSRERPGRGSVHHVAFRVEDADELNKWIEILNENHLPNSGFVERYYFKSLYFRESNGILFELATDGPGFEGDEDFEHLGQKLALPPYFEGQRTEIEARLEPLDTKG